MFGAPLTFFAQRVAPNPPIEWGIAAPEIVLQHDPSSVFSTFDFGVLRASRARVLLLVAIDTAPLKVPADCYYVQLAHTGALAPRGTASFAGDGSLSRRHRVSVPTVLASGGDVVPEWVAALENFPAACHSPAQVVAALLSLGVLVLPPNQLAEVYCKCFATADPHSRAVLAAAVFSSAESCDHTSYASAFPLTVVGLRHDRAVTFDLISGERPHKTPTTARDICIVIDDPRLVPLVDVVVDNLRGSDRVAAVCGGMKVLAPTEKRVAPSPLPSVDTVREQHRLQQQRHASGLSPSPTEASWGLVGSILDVWRRTGRCSARYPAVLVISSRPEETPANVSPSPEGGGRSVSESISNASTSPGSNDPTALARVLVKSDSRFIGVRVDCVGVGRHHATRALFTLASDGHGSYHTLDDEAPEQTSPLSEATVGLFRQLLSSGMLLSRWSPDTVSSIALTIQAAIPLSSSSPPDATGPTRAAPLASTPAFDESSNIFRVHDIPSLRSRVGLLGSLDEGRRMFVRMSRPFQRAAVTAVACYFDIAEEHFVLQRVGIVDLEHNNGATQRRGEIADVDLADSRKSRHEQTARWWRCLKAFRSGVLYGQHPFDPIGVWNAGLRSQVFHYDRALFDVLENVVRSRALSIVEQHLRAAMSSVSLAVVPPLIPLPRGPPLFPPLVGRSDRVLASTRSPTPDEDTKDDINQLSPTSSPVRRVSDSRITASNLDDAATVGLQPLWSRAHEGGGIQNKENDPVRAPAIGFPARLKTAASATPALTTADSNAHVERQRPPFLPHGGVSAVAVPPGNPPFTPPAVTLGSSVFGTHNNSNSDRTWVTRAANTNDSNDASGAHEQPVGLRAISEAKSDDDVVRVSITSVLPPPARPSALRGHGNEFDVNAEGGLDVPEMRAGEFKALINQRNRSDREGERERVCGAFVDLRWLTFFDATSSASSFEAALKRVPPSGRTSDKSYSFQVAALLKRNVTLRMETPAFLTKESCLARKVFLLEITPSSHDLTVVDSAVLDWDATEVSFAHVRRGARCCAVHIACRRRAGEWFTADDLLVVDGIEFVTPKLFCEDVMVETTNTHSISLRWDSNAPSSILTVQPMDADSSAAGTVESLSTSSILLPKLDGQRVAATPSALPAWSFVASGTSAHVQGLEPNKLYTVSVAPASSAAASNALRAARPPLLRHQQQDQDPFPMESTEIVVCTCPSLTCDDVTIQATASDCGQFVVLRLAAEVFDYRHQSVAVSATPTIRVNGIDAFECAAAVDRQVDVEVVYTMQLLQDSRVLRTTTSAIPLVFSAGPWHVVRDFRVASLTANTARIAWASTGSQFRVSFRPFAKQLMSKGVQEAAGAEEAAEQHGNEMGEDGGEHEDECCIVVDTGNEATLTGLRSDTQYRAKIEGRSCVNVATLRFTTAPDAPMLRTAGTAVGGGGGSLRMAHSASREELALGLPARRSGPGRVEWFSATLLETQQAFESKDDDVTHTVAISGATGILTVAVARNVTVGVTSSLTGATAQTVSSAPALFHLVRKVAARVSEDNATLRLSWLSGAKSLTVGVGAENYAFPVSGASATTGGEIVVPFPSPSTRFLIPIVFSGPSVLPSCTRYVFMAPPLPLSPTLFDVVLFEDSAVVRPRLLESEVSSQIECVHECALSAANGGEGQFVTFSLEFQALHMNPVRISLADACRQDIRLPLLLNRGKHATMDVRLLASFDNQRGASNEYVSLTPFVSSPVSLLKAPIVFNVNDARITDLTSHSFVVRWQSLGSIFEVALFATDGTPVGSVRVAHGVARFENLQPGSIYLVSITGPECGGHSATLVAVTLLESNAALAAAAQLALAVNGSTAMVELPPTTTHTVTLPASFECAGQTYNPKRRTQQLQRLVHEGSGKADSREEGDDSSDALLSIAVITEYVLQLWSSPPQQWTGTRESDAQKNSNKPIATQVSFEHFATVPWPHLSLQQRVSVARVGSRGGEATLDPASVALSSPASLRTESGVPLSFLSAKLPCPFVSAHTRLDVMASPSVTATGPPGTCVVEWKGSAMAYMVSVFLGPAVNATTLVHSLRKEVPRFLFDCAAHLGKLLVFRIVAADAPSNTLEFSYIVPPLEPVLRVVQHVSSALHVLLDPETESEGMTTRFRLQRGSEEFGHDGSVVGPQRAVIRLGFAAAKEQGSSSPPSAGADTSVLSLGDGRSSSRAPAPLNTSKAKSTSATINNHPPPSLRYSAVVSILPSERGAYPYNICLNPTAEAVATVNVPLLHQLRALSIGDVTSTTLVVQWLSQCVEFDVTLVTHHPTGVANAIDSPSGNAIPPRHMVVSRPVAEFRGLHPGAVHAITVRGRTCGDAQLSACVMTLPNFPEQSIIARRHADGQTCTVLTDFPLSTARPAAASSDIQAAAVYRCGPVTLRHAATVELYDDLDHLIETIGVIDGKATFALTTQATTLIMRRNLSTDADAAEAVLNPTTSNHLPLCRIPLMHQLSKPELLSASPNALALSWEFPVLGESFSVVAKPLFSFARRAQLVSKSQNVDGCAATIHSLTPSTLYEVTVAQERSYRCAAFADARVFSLQDDAPPQPQLVCHALTAPKRLVGQSHRRYLGGVTVALNPKRVAGSFGLVLYAAVRALPDHVVFVSQIPTDTSLPLPPPTCVGHERSSRAPRVGGRGVDGSDVPMAQATFITTNAASLPPRSNQSEVHHHSSYGSTTNNNTTGNNDADTHHESLHEAEWCVTEPAGENTHSLEHFCVVEATDDCPVRRTLLNHWVWSEPDVRPISMVRSVSHPQVAHCTSSKVEVCWRSVGSTEEPVQRCDVCFSNLSDPADTKEIVNRVAGMRSEASPLAPGALYGVEVHPSYHDVPCEALRFLVLTAPRRPKPPTLYPTLLNVVFDLPATKAQRIDGADAFVSGASVAAAPSSSALRPASGHQRPPTAPVSADALTLTTTTTALLICVADVDLAKCSTVSDYIAHTESRNVFKSAPTVQRIDLRLRSARPYVFVFFHTVHHPQALNGVVHSKPVVVEYRTDSFAPQNLHVITRTRASITVGWNTVDGVSASKLAFEVQRLHQTRPVTPAAVTVEHSEFDRAAGYVDAFASADGPSVVPSSPHDAENNGAAPMYVPLFAGGLRRRSGPTANVASRGLGVGTSLETQRIVTSGREPQMHCTFPDLRPEGCYAFRVRCVSLPRESAPASDGGFSPWSNIVVCGTLLPPRPVEKIVVTDITPTAISISWRAPEAVVGEAMAYVVTYRQTEMASSAHPRPPGTSSGAGIASRLQGELRVHECSATVSGLTPGCQYRITVTPCNHLGEVCNMTNASLLVRTEGLTFWKA